MSRASTNMNEGDGRGHHLRETGLIKSREARRGVIKDVWALRVLKEVENEQGTSTFDRRKALTELAALSFDSHVQTRWLAFGDSPKMDTKELFAPIRSRISRLP